MASPQPFVLFSSPSLIPNPTHIQVSAFAYCLKAGEEYPVFHPCCLPMLHYTLSKAVIFRGVIAYKPVSELISRKGKTHMSYLEVVLLWHSKMSRMLGTNTSVFYLNARMDEIY